MKNCSLGELLSQYLNNYLSIQKNYSNHTIRSYKLTFKELIKYLRDYKGIKIAKITLCDLNRKNILDFLNYIENDLGVSIITRNQRLAAIKSFCKYVSYEEIDNINNIIQILDIPSKKCDSKKIDFLTKNELATYLNSIKTNCRKGVRDYVLITLLYDTAGRISEISNLKCNDLRLNENPSVTLYGKGKKYRSIPITSDTKQLLIDYIKLFNISNFEYLFSGNKGEKCSTKMITHIVKKYAKISGIEKNIHPHVFRHTRAMHLLEAGIPLVYIRDILGHESITTTEIYAKVSVEIKRKMLEKISSDSNNKAIVWHNNPSLLEELLELD